MRSAVAAGVLALVAGLTTACGDDPPPAAPDLPDAALWNPCDGLSVGAVSKALGAPVTKQAGTAQAPFCRFTPETEGGPVLDANYSVAAGTLEQVIASFSADQDDVTPVRVPLADDAQVIEREGHGGLLLTGFVQNGDLIQVVNVVAPKPYDRALLRRGLRDVLGDLADLADRAGVGEGAPSSPSSSPSSSQSPEGSSEGSGSSGSPDVPSEVPTPTPTPTKPADTGTTAPAP